MLLSHNKPHKVQNSQHCTAASGDKINSLGIYEIDLQIKGKKIHPPDKRNRQAQR
jgi:hypothetical protein